ncbi:glutamyl-tRNA reductase [Winogradskyella maritima]|uniref:Glutamyl-tRNA reductase n=1 Tax=Winogradskyella maritima TaxID=1517766 RepID=A0ABV8ADF0_9FLAO|nr:glutamyl-tRNA reductase [Winogradskyella maritima]
MSATKTTHFYAIGLSYRKADAVVRGHFSLDDTAKENLLSQAKSQGVEALITVSTCNRTELYGFAEHPYQLIQHLCENTKGTVEEFREVAYIHKNKEAINHMFRVGSGLDSQILGDFEIIGQLKYGARQSKKVGLLNSYLERLVNAVIQASKRIKTETILSSGATSVSFASVQYILNNTENVSDKKILLFGTGKIGRNTCENLVKHSKNPNITLINRTKDKAEAIAGKFNLDVKSIDELPQELNASDIVIVATGANEPTVYKDLISTEKPLLILDLSIPKNVNEDVMTNKNVTLVHLDDLAKITDDTLEKRRSHIPKAEAIISEVMSDFTAWLDTLKFVPTIQAIKHKLTDLKNSEISNQRKKHSDFNIEQVELVSNNLIQKITNQFAHHLREDNNASDESLRLINKIFQLESSDNV